MDIHWLIADGVDVYLMAFWNIHLICLFSVMDLIDADYEYIIYSVTTNISVCTMVLSIESLR